MSKKFDKELLQLDLYEILGISIESTDDIIKKSYRKKALTCHPDRNPDNPDAAHEFIRLKKILEILIDPGARGAYDKVLKGRKAAAIRARESNAKSQKLRADLEKREQDARLATTTLIKISEEERLKRELKRLEDEGERIIAEELEKLNKEVEEELRSTKLGSSKNIENSQETQRIKVRWKIADDSTGYTEEEIRRLFYKWGEINAIVMKQRETKGTALVEYKDATGANMAVQFEKGLVGKPLEVSIASSGKKSKEKKKSSSKKDEINSWKDFESISTMNNRRAAERQKLIEEMAKNEDKS